tara:strand:- start:899 stop:1132 length:234 start_codon:yes stop_codon:yes gene_type:complete
MSNKTTDEFYDQLIDQGFLDPEYLQEWCAVMRDKLRDLHTRRIWIGNTLEEYGLQIDEEKMDKVHRHLDHLEGLVKQ